MPEGLVTNPGVRVEGGKVVRIGGEEEMGEEVAEEVGEEVEVVDCTGRILMPGMVDLHTHLYQHCTPLGVDPELCLARCGALRV